MRHLNLDAVLAAIDDANAADPNRAGGEPLALVQGRRAHEWVARLCPAPSPELRVAARAHHLRRWAVPRSSYPEGRAGYLRWRRDQKRRHAEEVAALLTEAGWEPTAIVRTGELIERKGLGRDPETQLVEDAACLVFLETQFDQVDEQLDDEKFVTVVAKTLAKMSPAAIEAALSLPLTARQREVLDAASSR